MPDASLNIILQALGGASVISTISSIGSALGSGGLGGALLAVGAAAGSAAIGIGVTAVKAAGNLQEGLTSLVTGAGEAQKNIGMVGNGILNLATQTGTSTAQLTSGMYQIESAGYHGSAGLSVLKASAEGAKVGNADLGTVANATTTIMTDFGIKSQNASIAVNTLVATVSNGKTTMDALSASLSNILPTASAAGVSLNDTAGAMATMTGESVPAAQAATYLRQTILGIEAPSKQTITALTNVGLKSSDVAAEMKKSLPDALQMITDAVGKKFPAGSAAYVNAIKDISGGSKTMQGMLDLTGSHMATFNADVNNIASAVKNGGNSITGWALVQQNFNFKLAQGQEILETFGIRLGQLLLPAVTNVMNAILPLASSFSSLLTDASPLNPVLSQISGMFGIMKANWQSSAPAFAPVMQAFRNFGALVSGLLPGALSQFLRALNDVNTVIGTVAVAVSGWISPALSILGQVFKGVQAGMEPVLNVVEGQLLPAFQNLVTAIAPIVTHILQWIASSGMITPLLTGLGVAISFVIGFASNLINVIANVVNFFTHNQVALLLLQAAFVTLGIILGIFVTTVLAGLIIGLVEAGIAAVTTGISMAIAFLPITLIVIGIVVVVALVILAIKNWGAISGWLQGAWSNVASFFTGIWHSIQQAFGNAGQWFQDQFKKASDGVKSGFGAVGAFFSNAWKGIQQAFGNVGNWFHDRFQQASDGVKTGFGNTGNWFQQQGNNIKQTAINIGMGVVNALQWMYQHNYYFKDLVDTINSLTRSLLAFLVGAWNTIKSDAVAAWNAVKNAAVSAWTSTVNFIKGLWTGLSATARSVWGAVSSAIMGAVNTIVGWVKAIWNAEVNGLSIVWHSLSGFASSAWSGVSSAVMSVVNSVVGWLRAVWAAATSWLGAQWNTLTGIARNVWSSITGVFQSAWGSISGALSGLWSNISGWFSNLAGQMVQFGENLINSLAQGILNAAGSVASAASSVAGNIAKTLGFHSPAKEGPASDADVWMPNLMNMLATGVLTSLPTFQAALNKTALAMSSTLQQSPSVAIAGQPSSSLQTPASVASSSSSVGNGNLSSIGIPAATSQNINLTLTIQAQKVDESEMDRIAQYSIRVFGDQIREQFGNV